jgi:hypothetical protein
VSRMNRFVIFICIAFVLCPAACINSSNRGTVLSYVPSSSFAVLRVNWQDVIKDQDLKRIARGAEIEKVFSDLGVATEKATEVVVLGNFEGPGAAGGLITKGNFETREITNSLKQRGWEEKTLAGKQAYVNPRDGSCLTTFDSNLLLFGTESGVKEVVSARTDPELRFTSQPIYKSLLARFEGRRYPILMMIALPQSSQDMANAALQISSTIMDLAGVGPLGELLNRIGYAKGLSCGISRDNDSFPVELAAGMKDEDSAKFVAGTLKLFKKLGAMAPRSSNSQRDIEAARALSSISIERSRDVVSIRLLMPRGAIR